MERAACRGPRLRPESDERWGYWYIPLLDDQGRPTRVVSERGKEYKCSSAVVRPRCDAVGRSVTQPMAAACSAARNPCTRARISWHPA